MEIYIIILLVLLCLSIRGIGPRMFFLVVILLSAIVGFRDNNIGTDTSAYIDYYNSMSSFDLFDKYMEKGWNALAIMCKYCNLSAYGFHFVVAFLTFLPLYIISVKYGDRKINCYVVLLFVSLGFYFHMFNIMRQIFSISIVLLGYNKLRQGKYLYFIIYVIIASFIHLASLFSLVMILVPKFKLNIGRVMILLGASYFFGFFAGERFFSAFAGKFAHDIYDYGFRSSIMFFLTVGLLTNLLVIWLYWSIPRLREDVWVRFNIFSVIILNLSSNLVLGSRIVYYFSICSIIAFALYMRYTSNKLILSILYLYAIITFGRYLVPELINIGNEGSMIPYSMKFQFFLD